MRAKTASAVGKRPAETRRCDHVHRKNHIIQTPNTHSNIKPFPQHTHTDTRSL